MSECLVNVLGLILNFWVLLSRFQSLTVLSTLAEAIVWPSGLKLTPSTQSWCPVKVCSNFLFARFQILTVLSELAEARVLPSGLKLTLGTVLRGAGQRPIALLSSPTVSLP